MAIGCDQIGFVSINPDVRLRKGRSFVRMPSSIGSLPNYGIDVGRISKLFMLAGREARAKKNRAATAKRWRLGKGPDRGSVYSVTKSL